MAGCFGSKVHQTDVKVPNVILPSYLIEFGMLFTEMKMFFETKLSTIQMVANCFIPEKFWNTHDQSPKDALTSC